MQRFGSTRDPDPDPLFPNRIRGSEPNPLFPKIGSEDLDPDPLYPNVDPSIRIHVKMNWIHADFMPSFSGKIDKISFINV